MNYLIKTRSATVIGFLFLTNIVQAQDHTGNGGAGDLLKYFFYTQHNEDTAEFAPPPSLTIESDLSPREKQDICEDFFQHARIGIVLYEGFTFKNSQLRLEEGYTVHFNEVPLRSEKLRDFRNAFFASNFDYLCDSSHMTIGSILGAADAPYRYGLANFPEQARIAVDPDLWKNPDIENDFCIDITQKVMELTDRPEKGDLDLCTFRIKTALAFHEISTLLWMDDEKNNSYVRSVQLLRLPSPF